MESVGKPVEGQRTGDRDDVAAIDQALAEAALLGAVLVEVDARGVLIKPGRDLMLGFFDRVAVDVIDLLADLIVLEVIIATGEREIVSRYVERRAGFTQHIRF